MKIERESESQNLHSLKKKNLKKERGEESVCGEVPRLRLRSTEPSSVSFQMSSSSACFFPLLLPLVSFLVRLHLLDAKSISNKALTPVAKIREP